MTTETKTNWRKNLDSRYISGEDLISGFKGLKPEMVVKIEKFNDDKTFDKNKAADVTVSALYLQEVNGTSLHKPVILNKTNARFFAKEMGSDFMEDWIGRPVTLFAQKDSRHGYVVRFKTYIKQTVISGSELFDKCKTALSKGSITLDGLKQRYNISSEVEALLNGKTV